MDLSDSPQKIGVPEPLSGHTRPFWKIFLFKKHKKRKKHPKMNPYWLGWTFFADPLDFSDRFKILGASFYESSWLQKNIFGCQNHLPATHGHFEKNNLYIPLLALKMTFIAVLILSDR